MQNLDKHIAELLEDHDCVIVPDFGGFVANYAPAKINSIHARFDPPHRKISFNKFLVHNDGLLTAYLAKKEEEAYENALQEVKQYALYLKQELRTQKKVRIEKVGLLYQHNDGTLHFEQVNNAAFFKEGFGLNAFFANPLNGHDILSTEVIPVHEKEATIEEPQEVSKTDSEPAPKPVVIPIAHAKEYAEKEAPSLSEEEPKPRRRYWPVAAALIGLPLIGYAIWLSMSTPIFKDPSRFHWSDLNPIQGVDAQYHARTKAFEPGTAADVEPVIIEEAESYIALTDINDPDKTMVVRLIDPKKTEKIATAEDLRYHIMGGCFSVKSNADGLIDRYRAQGNNASLIDEKGGLYRVSVASFATKKEAKRVLASIRNDIPAAWLLYK